MNDLTLQSPRAGRTLTTRRPGGTERETLVPGAVVANRYVIERRLATGGMGVVYAARQRPFERHIALKIMHPELALTAELRARFFQEARAASLLNHPNTITIYDFGVLDSGNCFIAMELVEGSTLAELLRQEGALPLSRVVPLIVQVAQSLSEAHTRAIVHRDLKPDNIMVRRTADGQDIVKVVDFGIAKILDDSALDTRAGTVCGTPAYMAPEQGRGGPLDGRADLYALGCCMFEALTGRPPFSAASVLDLLVQHQTGPIPHLPPELPQEIDAFLQRALAKEPDARPADATTFIAELLAAFLSVVDESVRDAATRPWASGVSVVTPERLVPRSEPAVAPVAPPRASTPAPDAPSAPARPTAPAPAPAPIAASAPVAASAPPITPWVGAALGAAAACVILAGLMLAAHYNAAPERGASADAPPPAAIEALSIELDSLPRGALAWVNGEAVGVTPVSISVRPEETLRVRYALQGYEDLTLDELKATPDGRGRLFGQLQRRQTRLQIVTPLNGASVQVGDRDLGVIPAARPRALSLPWPVQVLPIVIRHPDFHELRIFIDPAEITSNLDLTFEEADFVPLVQRAAPEAEPPAPERPARSTRRGARP